MAGQDLALFKPDSRVNGGDLRQVLNRNNAPQLMRSLVSGMRDMGISNGEIVEMIPELIVATGNGGGGGMGACATTGQQLQDALQQQGALWGEWPNGRCPTNVWAFLFWMMASSCTYNNFGKTSSAAVLSNTVVLPAAGSFVVQPTATSFGSPLPQEWSGEGAYHWIWRVKIDFEVQDIDLNNFTVDQIKALLFSKLSFKIIQFGTNDPVTTAVDFGEASDAQGSVFVPSAGGYFFPRNNRFVPWPFEPSIQAFDLSGTCPGVVGEDQYAATATFRAYWELMPGFDNYNLGPAINLAQIMRNARTVAQLAAAA